MIDELVRVAVKAALAAAFQIEDIEPIISHPETRFGDASTNIAFILAARLKRSPQELATELAAALSGEFIDEASAVSGFVNVSLTNAFWVARLGEINSDLGHSLVGEGVKVEVEYISANPTGPTTIGNARGGFIGDVLANILNSQGYDVTREYYFNNAGTQITKLVEAVKAEAGLVTIPDEDRQYRGEYVAELAAEFKAELATKTDSELGELLTQTIFERWIKPAIANMGISFDAWFNERDLLVDGRFRETIKRLGDKGLVYERDGATWLDTGKLGVAREARVIIKSNGDPTYLGPDLAFHDDLFGRRGFNRSIKVLGADHIDQFPSVRAAVLALHPDKQFEVASHSWLRLMRDGKEVKVSKRLGQFVTVQEFIDEVGSDMARFMILQRAAETPMDFDLNLAKEQSTKNPLWYVMYAYARAHSILEQASQRGLSAISTVVTLSPEEVSLVRQINRFPALLSEIATDFSVHRLTFFGIETARVFHELYESERIIGLDKSVASRRLYVIQRYIAFMDGYWKLLGITPIKRMVAEPPAPAA
jgi:arginyl-tRNA synthetase